MKLLILFFSFAFFLSCSSTETNKARAQQESRPQAQTESAKTLPSKKLSQFEKMFVSKQMKELIKSYKKMKERLSRLETKLELVLSRLAEEGQSDTYSLDTKAKKLIIIDREKQTRAYNVDTKAKAQALIQKVNSFEFDLSEESRDKLLDRLKIMAKGEDSSLELFSEGEEAENLEESSLIEEEITDDTNIFPDEGSRGGKEPETSSLLKSAKKLFEERAYDRAILKFQQYLDENPKGADYPFAAFHLGQSFKNLKMPLEAKVFFKELVSSHPKSLWARRAEKLLEE